MLNQSLINYGKVDFDKNTLFFGDNLGLLSDRDTPSEFVDLIYLDPPFNSQADYNILFREATGERSTAQIQAFSDFWHWDSEARHAHDFLSSDPRTSNLAGAFKKYLGKSDVLAYLSMMGIRLLYLERVLRPTGSIFLHCDPTASHYLKLLMDSIFGVRNFRNEIVWKRSHPKGLAFTRFARNHDVILYYAKDSTKVKWKMSYADYKPDRVARSYSKKDENGRPYMLDNLLNPNPNRPNLTYEFKGMTRVWRWTKERMLEADAKGWIVVPRDGKGVPRYKRYLDEQEGVPIGDFWDDIEFVKGAERLDYPTQKPEALLERIIESSTDVGDLILDPFCGCGTAIIAAEHLQRRWLGIDITFLAINLVQRRLKDKFPGIKFVTEGQPRDLVGAIALANQDRLNFQNWALSLIDARPTGSTLDNPKKSKAGADLGIDGKLTFRSGENGDIQDIIVQVKSGKVDVTHIREFRDVVSNSAAMGVFITLQPPTGPMTKLAQETEPYILKSFGTDHEYQKIQIITIEELLDKDKRNRLKLPQILPSFPEAQLSRRVPGHTEGKLM